MIVYATGNDENELILTHGFEKITSLIMAFSHNELHTVKCIRSKFQDSVEGICGEKKKEEGEMSKFI